MPTTLTYSPPPPQNSAECLRPYPCRYARYAEAHPVQPLKGHQKPCAASVSYRASVPSGHAGCGLALSYRASSPGGAGFCYRICTGTSESRLTAHYSLLTANSSYTFSAKEKDPETGLSYFGSRYYSSDLSVWLSVDPMAAKYPSLLPYTYCADNPVKLVDPNGEEINPIYDRFGYFLGTDDLGLQGDAIIMDKKDFRQNMSHTEAMSKSTCFDPSQSFAAEIRYRDHYKSLKDRPDYDGYITLDEANEWYRTGDGKPLFADLTKIDLSGFRSLGDSKVGKTYRFNLLLSTGPTDDGLVYGNLTFIRTSNNGVRAFADKLILT